MVVDRLKPVPSHTHTEYYFNCEMYDVKSETYYHKNIIYF